MTRLSIAVRPSPNPSACPTCGRPAEVPVGGRGYCGSCARAMRLFLSPLKTRELGDVPPGEVPIP